MYPHKKSSETSSDHVYKKQSDKMAVAEAIQKHRPQCIARVRNISRQKVYLLIYCGVDKIDEKENRWGDIKG